MRRSVMIAIGLALHAERAHADCGGKACTAAVPDTVPGVDQLLVRPTLTAASAAVSTQQKDTTFKATILPSQFVDADLGWAFNELRFLIQTDTSSSLTRLAVSTGYNPYSRRSKRVEGILRAKNAEARCGEHLSAALDGAEAAKQAAHARAAEQLAKEQAAADEAYAGALAAAKDDTNKKLEASAARTKQYADAADKQTKARADADADLKMATDAATKAQTTCVHERESHEWSQINGWSWPPAVTLTASYDLFPFGQQPDATDMTKQVDLEWHGGPMAQLSVEERPSERVDLQAWTSVKHVRPTGDPGVHRSTSYGGGITASWLAISFLPTILDKIPSSYLKDGFLPGIGIGTSLQYVDCTDGASCVKGRTSQLSVTPYIDVLLSSALQFRIALPITHYDAVAATGSEIASTFSLAGTIGSP